MILESCPNCATSTTDSVRRVLKKVQVYSLISSLKTYHPTLHLTPWSLDLFIRVPFQLHWENTVLQPFRRIELIVHIAISVLPGTHFHLSQVKHLRVKCRAQGHNILTINLTNDTIQGLFKDIDNIFHGTIQTEEATIIWVYIYIYIYI